MTHRIRLDRLLVAAILAAATACGTAGPAHAAPPAPTVPTDIAVPAGNKLYLSAHAVGEQIYTCSATATGYGWSLAPRADLYGDNGKLIATHFAGPTWQATDGSAVVGRRVASVTVDPTAIPWLKLEAASTTAGAQGDRLAGTTFIQRTDTTGGVSPAAADCTEATAGTRVEVPYTADYHFWKPTGN